MRKVDDGEKKRKKKKRKEKKKEKNVVFIGHYTSLPAVNRPNADRWNAARSSQNYCYTASASRYLSLISDVVHSESPLCLHHVGIWEKKINNNKI